MDAGRNFSMDSKLTRNGRDAPATQVPHLFRSRMCIVCWLPLISLSCQLWGFYTWKLDKSFPSGLEKFATCMDGKREEAKGDSRVNDEPLTSWRVVFTFLHSRNVKLQSDEIWWWRKFKSCRKLDKNGFFALTILLELILAPHYCPKIALGTFHKDKHFCHSLCCSLSVVFIEGRGIAHRANCKNIH